MPDFESNVILACPAACVFDLLSRPTHWIDVAPPEFNLRLLESPERLYQGARIVVQGRRWGFSQRIASEVTAFHPNELIVDEQREGPFKKWIHTRRLEPVSAGTQLTDHITFEPPGGMLGLLLTAERIAEELPEIFRYRASRFKELLESET